MQSTYQKLTKQEINDLPLHRYDGPIHVAASLNNANRAIDALLKENVIGFDTETRPAFRQDEAYLPSILQLAGHDAVYIFQLNKVGLCESILRILSNPDIIKCGVGLHRDRPRRSSAALAFSACCSVGSLLCHGVVWLRSDSVGCL